MAEEKVDEEEDSCPIEPFLEDSDAEVEKIPEDHVADVAQVTVKKGEEDAKVEKERQAVKAELVMKEVIPQPSVPHEPQVQIADDKASLKPSLVAQKQAVEGPAKEADAKAGNNQEES